MTQMKSYNIVYNESHTQFKLEDYILYWGGKDEYCNIRIRYA